MAGIAGAGQVIDVATIVNQLMAVERIPVTKLDTQIRATQAKITAYGSLKSKLATLQSAARALSTGFDVAKNSVKATASDPTALDVSVTGVTALTTRQVTINTLATKQRLQSADFASTTTDLGLTSTIQLEVGEWSGASFTADGTKTPKTIDLTGKSLTQIASAINAAGAGVSARIEGPAGASHLVLESTTEGSKSGFRITNVGGPAETDFIYDGVAGDMTRKVEAVNASVTVDGTNYTSQNNTVTGVPGLTLTLKSKPAAAVTITAAADSSLLKTKLEAFTTAYNDLLSYTKKVAPTGPDSSGDLKNDVSVPGILRSVRSAITQVTGPAEMSTLNQLGVRFEKDGTLKIDQEDLDSAVANKYDAVVGLLSGTNGATASIMSKVSSKIGDLLATDGVVGAKNDSLSKILQRQNDQRTRLADRLPMIEKQYLTTYSTLDAKLSILQQQLSSVTAALNGLTPRSDS